MELPLFVKANAIVPMYAENNNPEAVSDTNTKGTDRSQRIVEFFATEGDGTFTQYEDDGSSIENNTTEDDSYGTIDNISYGEHVSTVYRSKAAGGTATFTAEASQGGYNGYDSNRTTTFVANVSAKPMSVVAKNGGSALNVVEVDSQETFDTATPEPARRSTSTARPLTSTTTAAMRTAPRPSGARALTTPRSPRTPRSTSSSRRPMLLRRRRRSSWAVS